MKPIWRRIVAKSVVLPSAKIRCTGGMFVKFQRKRLGVIRGCSESIQTSIYIHSFVLGKSQGGCVFPDESEAGPREAIIELLAVFAHAGADLSHLLDRVGLRRASGQVAPQVRDLVAFVG